MRILALTYATLGILAASVLLALLLRSNSELNTTKDQLKASQAQGERLSSDLGATTEQLTNKIADLDTANAQLGSAAAENAGLRSELRVTKEHLTTQISENEALTTTFVASSEKLGSRTAENAALTSDLETVTRQLTGKSAEYETLLNEVGTLETLRVDRDSLLGEIEALRSSIRELKEQRTPLLVQSYKVGFRCTGSMEPKVTCLDSATWLRNFNPEDIAIGAVIVFTPTPECELGVGAVSHRVMDIREVQGTYYYWPKGDANAEADGCWIPDTNVYGYLIELHKDTHPGNSNLRNRMNAARVERDETFAQFKAAEDAYNRIYLEYCGSNPDACSLEPARVAELDRLYDEYIRLFELHQTAYEAWNVVYQEAWASY